MGESKCNVIGCGRQRSTRGFCMKHYQRNRFHGDPLIANHGGATHRKTKTRVYSIWTQMRQRCDNPNAPHYKFYGGRGIRVCERWKKFENFYADMGDCPSPRHTLDRIDNNKGYSPRNCRWATSTEQAANRRNTIKVTYNGAIMALNQAAKAVGMPAMTAWRRAATGRPIHPEIERVVP